MDWGQYGTFVGFAGLLVIAPGPDFAVTIKNSLAGGRRRGAWTALGIASSNALQGSAAALGLGALVLRSQPLFDAIRWAGVVYLAWLGIQALRGAVRGASDEIGARAKPGTVWTGWRQGFLSNITNPKVLAFYIAVLPQFLSPRDPTLQVLALALTHATLSATWLLTVVTMIDRVRAWVSDRRVRRVLDLVLGVVLLGFSTRLATERA